MAFQEHDLRYGMTVPEVLREIDSPLFDSCRPKEYAPLDPSHKVFYGQFLRKHFEDYTCNDRGVAAIDLYNSFYSWKEEAMRVVDPTKYAERGNKALYQTYEGMSLDGLFQHVDEESVFSRPNDPPSVSTDFTEEELNFVWLVTSDAWKLENMLHELQAA